MLTHDGTLLEDGSGGTVVEEVEGGVGEFRF
jgi:hypothetical protein